MRKLFPVLGLAALLAVCSEIDPPAAPPPLRAPPEVATSGFLTAYTEETISMSVPELRAFMEREPLIGFLEPTENIADPVEAWVLEGMWPEPGAARWLRLSDEHYVVERVLGNEPELFRYQVFVFTNATGRGVEQIVGEQRFVPMDGGTRVEWTYAVLPRNFVARQIVRGSMDEIEAYIAGGLSGLVKAAQS